MDWDIPKVVSDRQCKCSVTKIKMIKHLLCEKEFKEKLQVRFFPIYCESSVYFDYRSDGLYVQLPFNGIQIYNNPSDLLSKPKCQAEVFCPYCENFYPIKEFEFYMACILCGKKSAKLVKVYCRKNERGNTLHGCLECIKKNCISLCGRQRGLCESWRDVIYRHQTLREE